jgi:hypothetical protein
MIGQEKSKESNKSKESHLTHLTLLTYLALSTALTSNAWGFEKVGCIKKGCCHSNSLV